MTDNVVRPMKSPRHFFERAASQATERALGGELPEGSESIRRTVEVKSAELLRGEVRREIAGSLRMGKEMEKLEKRTRKQISKAQANLAKAERLAGAYPDNDQLQGRLRGARRELRELHVRAGRAGQASAEWSFWASRLKQFIPEIERAVEQTKPTRRSAPAGTGIILGGSGYQPVRIESSDE